MSEIRCENKMHGELVEGFLEIKCRSSFCGSGPGIVVIHRFDVESGKLVETNRYRDPRKGE